MTNLSEYTVLGLMSGTSLDGLDMALCRFTKENSEWHYSVFASATRPYDEPLRLRLSAATDLSALEYVRLDAQLACVMAGYINDFLAQQTLKPDFIASHGQT
ncbi:MAG: anhydro-N-acetylmuramic acid kinase, partial [Tannerella sp.]|nr:anhydro-N-acetylmuramic acid kinase [Tannerella sp.]